MTIETTTRKSGKGRTMSVESIQKTTCDGCGVTRSFVLGKTNRDEHPPWYRIGQEFEFHVVGQATSAHPDIELDATNYKIHACSAECAAKALLKRLPKLPERLPAKP